MSYLRRTAHHQLYEVPATSLGCVDVSNRFQAFQGAVLRQAADKHGPLRSFGHPAGPSHLLALAACRVSLVQVRHANHRGRLSPPSVPQLHLSSSRCRSCRAGLAILVGGHRLLDGICLFVIVQAVTQRRGCFWKTKGQIFNRLVNSVSV